MSQPQQDTCENRLLRVLAPASFALLQPDLEALVLAVGDVLIKADTPIPVVCFIERGIVSLIAVVDDGEQIETALVGREGLVGVPILLEADRTPGEARVQAHGFAYAMPADALRAALRRSPELAACLLRYAQVLGTQVACTALANGRYKLEQRLARWLLMCHDRVDGDVLPTTHRFLSLMLGVNRPGLTSAVAAFERRGLIETRRGSITIHARATLLTIAGAAYGTPEAEYAHLIAQARPA